MTLWCNTHTHMYLRLFCRLWWGWGGGGRLENNNFVTRHNYIAFFRGKALIKLTLIVFSGFHSEKNFKIWMNIYLRRRIMALIIACVVRTGWFTTLQRYNIIHATLETNQGSRCLWMCVPGSTWARIGYDLCDSCG